MTESLSRGSRNGMGGRVIPEPRLQAPSAHSIVLSDFMFKTQIHKDKIRNFKTVTTEPSISSMGSF